MKATRRPQFWFGLIMWLMSFVVTGLLIELGSLVMSDLPTAKSLVKQSDFINQVQLKQVRDDIKLKEQTLTDLEIDIEDANLIARSHAADYENQRENLNSWIKTREATQADQYNAVLIERTQKIELLRSQQRAAQKTVEKLNAQRIAENRALNQLNTTMREIKSAAIEPYNKAQQWEVLKVFLVRLLITLPLLLISIWFIVRKRKSKYWPLYRGFVMFSLFAFFVELVPYLPSYGGYVRILVGIVLVIGFAHVSIRAMTRYLEKKKDEENRPEVEKRQVIEYETAVKKISEGLCPSCDRRYQANLTKKDDKTQSANVDFCVHCGFCLFDHCENCGTRANSFYKFCGACGTNATDKPPSPQANPT